MLITFLSLPSELRNRIYELLLMGEEPIDSWPGKPTCLLDIFRVNNAIHREASSIFYAQN